MLFASSWGVGQVKILLTITFFIAVDGILKSFSNQRRQLTTMLRRTIECETLCKSSTGASLSTFISLRAFPCRRAARPSNPLDHKESLSSTRTEIQVGERTPWNRGDLPKVKGVRITRVRELSKRGSDIACIEEPVCAPTRARHPIRRASFSSPHRCPMIPESRQYK